MHISTGELQVTNRCEYPCGFVRFPESNKRLTTVCGFYILILRL